MLEKKKRRIRDKSEKNQKGVRGELLLLQDLEYVAKAREVELRSLVNSEHSFVLVRGVLGLPQLHHSRSRSRCRFLGLNIEIRLH